MSLFGFISTFLVFGARLCEPQHARTLKVQPFLNALCLVTVLRVADPRSGRDGFGKFEHYPKLITLRKAEEHGQGSGELVFMYLMGYITLLAGPGRFSVNKAMFGKGGSSQSK